MHGAEGEHHASIEDKLDEEISVTGTHEGMRN